MMTVLAGIGFTTPWVLLGLLTLPILWMILRAVPPAPIRRLFPAVTLLLDLKDDESASDLTPWWLLLLRMLAAAAIIIGLAGPVLNPSRDESGSGPLMLVLDASWAGATLWSATLDQVDAHLTEAGRAGRPVSILRLTEPETPVFRAAEAWRGRLPGLVPMPWQPTGVQIAQTLEALDQVEGGFDTHWFSDRLEYDGHDQLVSVLQGRGDVTVYQSPAPVTAILPATFQDGAIRLSVQRTVPGPAESVTVLAQGRDPAGIMRVLQSTELDFESGSNHAQFDLVLPSELRARITRFEIQGQRSTGAVTLTDDSLRRREVALIAGTLNREGLELLSPLHYLTQVLIPTTDFVEGGLSEVLPANPDVIVLADVTKLFEPEQADVIKWVEQGGLLLRFAGLRLAASDFGRDEEDTLLPVRLRSGGRSVGGAMSWGEAKGLAPFSENSPFYGLEIPEDVSVTTQVMAQPDPNLADRVIASLSDGTPLVTRKPLGLGQVVLFHVTADAEWSSLPLSGLFVEMLDRLAVASAAKSQQEAQLQGTVWEPVQILDGFGTLTEAGTLAGVDGVELVSGEIGPYLRPGLYESGKQKLARNVVSDDAQLTPAVWPADVPIRGQEISTETPLAGLLLSIALVLLTMDVIASLALSGRLGLVRAMAVALSALLVVPDAQAQTSGDTEFALNATQELALAHVLTGNSQVDDIALAGLRGLAQTLYYRTSVEPADPVGVDLERDELAFFPLLYWPVTPEQPQPSAEAYAALNAYLRSGGMILFDTRDAGIAGFGASGPNQRKLQQFAGPLNLPSLEPIPRDHVLTRAFYLLQDFPGRYSGTEVWVEAALPNAEQIEGMPFRNLNDNVTPVVIGGNDWAGAWAVDRNGQSLLPVGRGYAGERQRELANRFGVNLVMHVLTGNYKSDQVHVPALLDRLGQ